MFSPDDTTITNSRRSTCTPLDHLNGLLSSRSLSPVRSVLRMPWDDISERTKRQYTRKAKQVISVALDEIAPQESESLWQALTSAQSKHDDDNVDKSLLKALADCYNNASKWDTRRQILSYMADKTSLDTICQYIPGLTRYRFAVARQHILEHGRGLPVLSVSHTRRLVPQEKLSHFLDFITSSHIIQDLPFGGKKITLSNKEVIQVPNVVRNMIPERIVQQYHAYCEESKFSPLSRSTLLRILQVCSASTRKSLQGLDYFSANGAEAFDNIEDIVDRLGENMEIDMSWANLQKEKLKSYKRYLKCDYKVSKI